MRISPTTGFPAASFKATLADFETRASAQGRAILFAPMVNDVTLHEMMLLRCALVLALPGLFLLTGCKSPIEHVGMGILYRKAALPDAQVHLDMPYVTNSTLAKQRLDLFVPTGTNWPVFVFVFGGGWTFGDKSMSVAGDDVYGNIGRFYAQRGIGVAVVNYRLLSSTVKYPAQIDDVAQATAWVHEHIAEYGGDPKKIFLGGHSAGAQIASRVALDPRPLASRGLSTSNLNGVICVSGAGLDMNDQETYDLGESPGYFAMRFDTLDGDRDWRTEGSPISYARAGAPPFLVMHATWETKSLIRQAKHFSEVLSSRGVTNQLVKIPHQYHTTEVLTLSRPGKISSDAILKFIRENQRR